MLPKIHIILAAAGKSRRMGEIERNKPYLLLGDQPVLSYSLSFFEELPFVGDVIIVADKNEIDFCRKEIVEKKPYAKVAAIVSGGEERQQSIFEGLKALKERVGDSQQWVAVHDSARPFLNQDLFIRLFQMVQSDHAVVPGVRVQDTIKQVIPSGWVMSTPKRSELRAIQTPQLFYLQELYDAYQKAESEHFLATDDAMLYEKYIGPVRVLETDWNNVKITTQTDWEWAQYRIQKRPERKEEKMRIGIGYDVHAFIPGDFLTLGGVQIPYDRKLKGHSDADVLVHAICDALLGAAALGDIGQHFPDTEERYKNIDSLKLLKEVWELLQRARYQIGNIDSIIIAQKPKMAPYIPQMQKKIAETLQLPLHKVSVKATTTEKLGFTGREEGIAAQAAAFLEET